MWAFQRSWAFEVASGTRRRSRHPMSIRTCCCIPLKNPSCLMSPTSQTRAESLGSHSQSNQSHARNHRTPLPIRCTSQGQGQGQVRSTQAQEQARVSARGLGRRSRTRHRSHRLRSSCRCWRKSHLDSSSRSNHCLQSRTCTQPLGRCVHGEGKAREVRGHSSERVAAA